MNEKILIVDDEESIRYTYRNFLEEACYDVFTAEDYKTAVLMLEKNHFDLVYIDILLNGQTGIDLLRRFKPRTPNCQFIIVTGVPTVETAAEAIRLGALDYIVKPVRQDTLLRTSGMAIRHKALAESKEMYRKNMEAIFRSVKDGIVSVDKDMTVLEMNQAASSICGVTRSDALGRSFSELGLKCNAGCIDALKKTLSGKETIEFDHLECGSECQPDQTVNLCATPMLNRHDEFTGAVMLVRDQTRMLRLESSLRDYIEFDNIVGNSRNIQTVFSLIRDLANVQTSVLITGESGTGKELVANAIHCIGDRRENPLVKVNCAALTESLLESELFGHVHGAFTGAVADKTGRFQRADGGTIFLDEIGEISHRMQLRLLRVLEEKEIEPVGGTRVIKVDVRVLAATNQNLARKVKQGTFRRDLYYRLNVVQVKLPPLRDRQEDIPLLVQHFLGQFNKKFNTHIKGVSTRAMRQFMKYSWPGNVRELKNILEHAFVLCRSQRINIHDLPPDFMAGQALDAYATEPDKSDALSMADIEWALKESSGNKSHAARLLGISRRTIYRKMDQFRTLN